MANTYTIAQGDTLSKIAAKYGTSVNSLASYNQIANPDLIKAGSVLNIPDATSSTTLSPGQFGSSPTPTVAPKVDAVNIGNTKPYTVAPTIPDTSYAGLETSIATTNEAIKKESAVAAQKVIDDAKAELESGKTDIGKVSKQIGNIENRREDLYKEGGVDTAKMEVDRLTSEIESEQLSTRRRIEKLQETNPTGMLSGALNSEVNRIQRESLSKQADMAILQNAALRRYDTAAAIADRKVQAELEPLKARLDTLKFFYTENKESFTKAEERQFQEKIRDEERNYTETKERKEDINAILIEASKNRAPSNILSAISKATTVDEAVLQSKGFLSDDLERQIKLAQLNKLRYENNLALGLNPNGTKTSTVGPYGDVINTILGSGKFTKDQSAQIRNAINSGQDPLAVIKNNAQNIMGQTEATKVINYEVAKTSLEDIQTQLAKFYDAGGTTNILSGKFEKVVNKLGEVNDPQLVELATQIAASLQIYRNAVSGTAYSVQEGADIATIFPGINKTEGLNTAILNGRMRAFDSVIDGTYRSVLGSGWDTLKAPPSTSTTISRGSLGAKEFVEKALTTQGLRYTDVIAKYTPKLQTGEQLALDNSNGQVVAATKAEIASGKYTPL